MLRRGFLAVALLFAAAFIVRADPLDDLEREGAALMKETHASVDELAGLSKLYADDGRFEELTERRRVVREALLPKFDRLMQVEEEYDQLMKAHHLQSVTFGLNALGDAKKVQAEAGAQIAKAMAIEVFHKELVDAKRRSRESIQTDEFNFLSTQAAIASRKKRWTFAATLGTLAALLGGGAFVAGRVRRGPAPAGRGATIGTVIGGNYKIEREIGRGAMGQVYEATDVTLRRKVAIKKMREELLASPKDLELFLAEARLVASLKHPNIVEIYSIVKEGGELFLVFEFVSGKPLNAVIQERGRLTLEQVRRVAYDVGSALDYAHGQKVIHRDLKPANVMIGGDGRAKVMDFGIAHQASTTVAKMTRAEAWGTPPYMAPEAELGRIGRESDLYSLGVCVYEMLTGKLPFEGPNYLAQKREMKLRPVSQVEGTIPPTVDQTLLKALNPEPDARFHSAAQLVSGLA